MIPGGLRVFVALEPIDMRRSIDGLAAAVAERLKQDVNVERALWVFANARRDRVKVLWRDATGWCLLYKRLEGHRTVFPDARDDSGRVLIDARALTAILDGIKRRPSAKEIVQAARAKVSISAPTSTTSR